jgi:hypothetical protein
MPKAAPDWHPDTDVELSAYAFGVAITHDWERVLLRQALRATGDSAVPEVIINSHLTVQDARQLAAKLIELADNVDQHSEQT